MGFQFWLVMSSDFNADGFCDHVYDIVDQLVKDSCQSLNKTLNQYLINENDDIQDACSSLEGVLHSVYDRELDIFELYVKRNMFVNAIPQIQENDSSYTNTTTVDNDNQEKIQEINRLLL